jgi:hypothetical protein
MKKVKHDIKLAACDANIYLVDFFLCIRAPLLFFERHKNSCLNFEAEANYFEVSVLHARLRRQVMLQLDPDLCGRRGRRPLDRKTAAAGQEQFWPPIKKAG